MGPLDMTFMAIVVFAVFKIVQLWIIWEIQGKEED